MTATVAPPSDFVPGKENIVVEYATAESIVVTEDNLPVAAKLSALSHGEWKMRRLTRWTWRVRRPRRYLARHDSPAVTYPVQTIPGKLCVEMVRPGTAPMVDLR